MAIDLITFDTTAIVNGKQKIWTLDIDTRNKKIYFAEQRKEIRRTNYDGTYEESVVKDAETWSVTMDWIGRRIFWTDPWKNAINVATLNGKDSRTLIETSEPLDIAIDPIDG